MIIAFHDFDGFIFEAHVRDDAPDLEKAKRSAFLSLIEAIAAENDWGSNLVVLNEPKP